MNRRKAREYAFICIFQHKFQDNMDEILEYFYALHPDCEGQEEYINDVCGKFVKNSEYIDALMEKYLKGWKMDRVSMVSLAVMRLAICEMLYREDIPIPISVNEAVMLIKKYEGEEAIPFINGVLGSVQKELEE